MTRQINNILKWIFALLFLLILGLVYSGNGHLFKGVYQTYLQGKTAPGIFDLENFPVQEVKKGSLSVVWPKNPVRNKLGLSALEVLEKRNANSFLIIQSDRLIVEQYWDSLNQNKPSNSFSMAKSIVSLLVGIAIEEGKIKSLDEPVGEYFPEYSQGKNPSLRLRHLITMSSDLNWTESGGDPFSDNAKAYYGDDLEKLLLEKEVLGKAGLEFDYMSGNTQLLAMVLEKATGKSLGDYASEKIWKRIGVESDAFWSMDKEGGVAKAYCCFYAKSRDFARLGKMMLDSGKWEGEQIIPSWYMEEALVPAPLHDKALGKANERYGYSWWLETYKGRELFYARGIFGQYIIVIPEEDVIIVRTGHERGEVNERGHPVDLYEYLDITFDIIESKK